MFQFQFLSLFSSNVSFSKLLSIIIIQLKLSFCRIFEKMKLCPFHRGKVDNLFVVAGGNCTCHGCVFGDQYSYRSHEYQIDFLGLYYWFFVYFVSTEMRSIG